MRQRGRLTRRRRRLGTADGTVTPGGVVAAIGLLRSSSGLGESARIFSRACRDAGFSVLPVDLSGRLHGFDRSVAFDQASSHRFSRLPERHADTVVVHLNGELSVDALAALDLPSVGRAWRAAYWHWELPKMPDAWRRSADYFNEIWVPSVFVRDAVAPYVNSPVRVLPHCLDVTPPSANMRQRLGIDENVFVALTVFDFRSSIRRKNPISAIKAFQRAFGADPSVLLLVKFTHGELFRAELAELNAAIGDSPNIRTLDAVVSRADMRGLIEAADTVLSLHRSEGFGLIPAEAMLLGKPVVATDWSATSEFMDPTNSLPVPCDLIPVDDPVQYHGYTDQRWADPDVRAAADRLAELRASPALGAEIGARARHDAQRLFAQDLYQHRLRNFLIPPDETVNIRPMVSPRAEELVET